MAIIENNFVKEAWEVDREGNLHVNEKESDSTACFIVSILNSKRASRNIQHDTSIPLNSTKLTLNGVTSKAIIYYTSISTV